jgi:hypothetical protein
MEEKRLDNELERLYKKLPFLWEDFGFHVQYFIRDYGMYGRGFLIGLGNRVCNLVFEKETDSQNEPIHSYVGKRSAWFAPPNYSHTAAYGWYPLPGLIYWLSGIECERSDNVDQDLENVSGYLKLHMEKVLDLFKSPREFDEKLAYYRNLHQEDQITVEKIRTERARLQALGQDWSLEAAMTSLRGGRK